MIRHDPARGLALSAGGAGGGALCQWDFAAPDAYTTDGGVVDLWRAEIGGSEFDLTNATAGQRPAVGTLPGGDPAAVFSGAAPGKNLFAVNDKIGPVFDGLDAAYEVDLIFSLDTLGNASIFSVNASGSNDPNIYIGTVNDGRIRFSRRHVSTTVRNSDTAVGLVTTGTLYALTTRVRDGLISMWLNGTQVMNQLDVNGSTTAISVDKIGLGGRLFSNPALPLVGKVRFCEVRPL